MKTQKLPKWFKGQLYLSGALVTNPFTGIEYQLNPMELSMYDLIKGAEMLGLWTDVQKGCEWFRCNNTEAYMALLD